MKKSILAFLVVTCMVAFKANAQKVYVGVDDPAHELNNVLICNSLDSIPFFDHTVDNSQYRVLSRYWHFWHSPGEKTLIYDEHRPVVYGKWDEPGEYKVMYHMVVVSQFGDTGILADEIQIHIVTSKVQLQRKKLNLTHYQYTDRFGNLQWADSAIVIVDNSEPAYYRWMCLANGMINTTDSSVRRLIAEIPGFYTVEATTVRGSYYSGGHTNNIDSLVGCSSIDTFQVFPDPKYLGIVEQAPSEMHLYPNPTENILHLSSVLNYDIYDIYGRKVTSGESDLVDVGILPKGCYYLRTNNNSFGKFQKN
jgi:hypothetical protein